MLATQKLIDKINANLLICNEGSIWAWGLNSFGQLGDNTTITRSSPVSVVGGYTDWCQVSFGDIHSLALRTNGTAWAWGPNGSGELGDGGGLQKSSPISVVGGFTDWCKIDAGTQWSLALRSNGTIWTWGNNSKGQLGDNSTTNKSSPVSVAGGFTDWCQISSGSCSGFGIRSNGTLWGWGYNACGVLGDNTTTSRSSPVSIVGGFTDWCQVSSSISFFPHTIALRTNGTVWTWGINDLGQLGDNTTTTRSSPVSVVGGITDWCQISAGNRFNSALRTNGTAWGWGYNETGTLGDNTATNRSSPVSVVGGFTDWLRVDSGFLHTLAIKTNGTAWAWGTNATGQLGDNTTTSRSSPVSVAGGFTDWYGISAGYKSSLVIKRTTESALKACQTTGALNILANNKIISVSTCSALPTWPSVQNYQGRMIYVDDENRYYYSIGNCWLKDFDSVLCNYGSEIYAWGSPLEGELGNNEDNFYLSKSSPVSVVGGFTDWCQISAGRCGSVALRRNGTAWAWGQNNSGQLGDNTTTNRSSPVSVVGGFTDWCQVKAGLYHTIALRSNGTAWAWGRNSFGRLGDNTTTCRSSPVSVVGGFTDWCQISAGGYHNLALRTNGTAWAWGSGCCGRLGDGTVTSRSSPVSVVGGFTDWCQVSAGEVHSIAIRTGGTAWTWGRNCSGVLGDNTTTSRSSPVSVVGGFTDWCQVSAGGDFNIGIRANGLAWGWGYGNRIGDNTATSKSSPVSVVGGFTDWCQVSAGCIHTVALRTNGTAWAWGNANGFRLGDGTTTNRSSPVSVIGGITDWCQVSAKGSFSLGIRKINKGC